MSSSESCTADAEASEAAGARHPDDAPPLADPPCTNAHTGCGNWARIGECARNPRFMRDGCRSACGLCGARHECVRDVNMRSVFANGALERLMRRVGASHGARAISTDPWLIIIDGFLSKDEARDVVDVAAREGNFGKSADVRYASIHRTSSTAFCGVTPSCKYHPAIQKLEARAESLLGVPLAHAEPLQIVRYGEGEEYRTHHDQNCLRDEPWGVRALTLFVYLSSPSVGYAMPFKPYGSTMTNRIIRSCVRRSMRFVCEQRRDLLPRALPQRDTSAWPRCTMAECAHE